MGSLAPSALALIAVTVLAYAALVNHPPSWPRSLIKTVPVTVLALGTLALGGPVLLALAFAFGAAGDFWLSRPGGRAFLVGLICFALGHLALVALLWPGIDASFGILTLWPLALAGAMVVICWRGAGQLRGPVVLYALLIAVMGWTAFQPAQPDPVRLAAFFFIVSDTLLGLELFALPERRRMRDALGPVIWLTYVLAQFLFFLGLAAI